MPAPLRLVPPPKPRGVLLQVILPVTEDTRLVRMACKDAGPDGALSGFWRLQRLEPCGPPGSMLATRLDWRTVSEVAPSSKQKLGQLPRGVRIPHQHFVTQLRQAADELEKAMGVAR